VNAYEESLLLPQAVRNVFFEDILLDYLISCTDSNTVDTLLDARAFVQSHLKSQIELSEDIKIMSTVTRLSVKLIMFNSGNAVINNDRLKSLIRSAKKADLSSSPLVILVKEEGHSTLVVRVPGFDISDETTAKSVALLLNLAMAVHGIQDKHLEIVIDHDIAKNEKLALSKTISNLVNGLISSSQLPKGFYAGEDIKFSSGYVCTLPGLLSSMRLLNWKKEYLRRKKRLPEGASPVTYHDLLESFNVHSGLKSEEQKGWPVDFIKAILNSCIKHSNTGFPSGWIYQNRVKNRASSDFAVLHALGWVEKVASKSKLLEVLFTTVDEDDTVGEDGKRRVVKRTVVNISKDKRQMSLPEFRTGVSMLLPRIDCSSDLTVKEQIKEDPLSITKVSTLTFSMEPSMVEAVDILNDAHLFRVSIKNPKSKTQPVHYQAKRQQLLSKSAHLKLTDASGTEFKSIFDIPSEKLKDFSVIFPYKIKPRRVTVVDTQPQENDVEMVNTEGDAPTSVVEPPQKRKRLTKGASKKELRSTGRLARNSKRDATSRSAPTTDRVTRSMVHTASASQEVGARLPAWSRGRGGLLSGQAGTRSPVSLPSQEAWGAEPAS